MIAPAPAVPGAGRFTHPMALPTFIEPAPGGVRLRVKAQPRASRNEIAGTTGDELKVRVTAPPVDSAANEAVLDLLAEILGVRRAALELVRGNTARHKIVYVAGLDAAAAHARLAPLL